MVSHQRRVQCGSDSKVFARPEQAKTMSFEPYEEMGGASSFDWEAVAVAGQTLQATYKWCS
eukprot:6183768-Pleurochrysis_carterae.AAC.5